MTSLLQIRRRLSDEDGFTLMELMVGTMIALIVFFTAVNFLGVAQRSQLRSGDRAEALGQQRVGLERITRELRQADTVWSTGAALELTLPASDSNPARRVLYDCGAGGACRRYETPEGQPFASDYREVVTEVDSATFAPSEPCDREDQLERSQPCHVSIDLRVSLPDREVPIALTDGVYVRNQPEG